MGIIDDKEWFTTRELADYLGFNELTLVYWRSVNVGPPFVKMSTRRVRYPTDKLKAWLAERTGGDPITGGRVIADAMARHG